jgi:hypothetical protein
VDTSPTPELGSFMLEEDYRSTIFHALREEGGTLAGIAREMEISTHRLRKFLRGALLYPENTSTFAEWCNKRGMIRANEEQAALALLSSELAYPQRLPHRERMVRYLRAAYLRASVPVPGWIADELANCALLRKGKYLGR